MATYPIYIETEEEIPEVVERLRKAMADEIRLVLPLRSRLGQSRFNFELLKRYATQFGKRVMIVSADPAVQQMAEETGFEATGVDPEPAGTAAVAAAAVATPVRPAPVRPAAGPKISVVAPVKLPSKVATQVHPGRFVLYTGISLILMVGAIGTVLYTPQAKVTLYAKAVQYRVPDIEVNAEPGKPPVKVRVATVQKTASQGVKTTGEKVTPGVQGTGSVTWRNSCSFGFNIDPGQRVYGGGQEFAVTSGTTLVEGRKSASTDIKAVNPGQGGNGASINDFQAHGGSDGQVERLCLTVSGGPTTGGQDEKHESTVAAADIDAARGQLEQQLRKEIGEDLIHQAGQGEKMSDLITFSAPDFNPDHKVGDVASGVGGTMSLKGEGAFYSEADVIKELQTQMVKRVPQDQVLTDNKITVEYRVKSAAPGGRLSFLGTAVGYIAPKLNFEQIKSRLAGKSTSQASSYLKSLPIDHAEVKMSPVQLPLMPLLNTRIDINYKVQTQPADKAPTPSPKPS
jgi:hypothetical protein